MVVKSKFGLHARPAARIATIAEDAKGPVWLEAKSCTADAREVMDMLALACLQGTHINVCIENYDDKPVLNQIVAFFESGFEGVL